MFPRRTQRTFLSLKQGGKHCQGAPVNLTELIKLCDNCLVRAGIDRRCCHGIEIPNIKVKVGFWNGRDQWQHLTVRIKGAYAILDSKAIVVFSMLRLSAIS